jgi:hypothetical protein
MLEGGLAAMLLLPNLPLLGVLADLPCVHRLIGQGQNSAV